MRRVNSRPSHWRFALPRNTLISIEAGSLLGRRSIIACCAIGILTSAAVVSEAQIGIGSGLRVDPPSKSVKDLRDQNVVRQRFDFSCGAAALATLLRYGFGESVTERELLAQLFGLLSDQEKTAVRDTGFSLLHLQRVAEARGYQAAGFRLEPEQLAMLRGPVIVFIQPHGYKHFAVLRGVHGDRVYLADPSRGNIRMPAYTFLDGWLQPDSKGIIFAVEPKSGLPESSMPLTLIRKGLRQPEIMTAREMLTVGNLLVGVPAHSR